MTLSLTSAWIDCLNYTGADSGPLVAVRTLFLALDKGKGNTGGRRCCSSKMCAEPLPEAATNSGARDSFNCFSSLCSRTVDQPCYLHILRPRGRFVLPTWLTETLAWRVRRPQRAPGRVTLLVGLVGGLEQLADLGWTTWEAPLGAASPAKPKPISKPCQGRT